MTLSGITLDHETALVFVSQVVFAVGRITPTGGSLLGTCFAVAPGKFATAKHVTNGDDTNLVLFLPKTQTILEYQDTSSNILRYISAKIIDIDPFKDICILSVDAMKDVNLMYFLGSTDDILPGSSVSTFGFPHADHGRLVLTQHNTHIGARVLIESSGLKSKHVILNILARPGQSGAPVINLENMSIVGMIIGAYAPSTGGSMSFGGIDTRTLHQTTHAISAEYLKEMI